MLKKYSEDLSNHIVSPSNHPLHSTDESVWELHNIIII